MSKRLGVDKKSGCYTMGGGGCCYADQASLHFTSGSSCLYLLRSRDRYVPSHQTNSTCQFLKDQNRTWPYFSMKKYT